MTAGSGHTTVLLQEAVDALNVRSDGIYVDATFGRGGHSRLILERLGAQGRLIALDRDPAAILAGQTMQDSRLTLVHSAFGRLRAVLQQLGVAVVDGVLLDLGVSSPQLMEAPRGFSFRADGPLDMRMDVSRGQTAAEWIAAADEDQIGKVIKTYGEERFAKQIARAIVAARSGAPITTTRQLAAIVAEAVRTREPNQDPATRTFQAIRIFINQELEELALVLPQALELLNTGGRLVVISFHSLEDRMVKRCLQAAAAAEQLPRRLPVRAAQLQPARFKLIGKPIRPSEAEVAANPRSRSAIMRVAERLAA